MERIIKGKAEKPEKIFSNLRELISSKRLDIFSLFTIILISIPLFLTIPGYIDRDAALYLASAKSFFNGTGLWDAAGQLPIWRGPVFPMLLSFSFLIGGNSIFSAVLVSKISGLLMAISVFFIGKQLYGRTTGLIGAFLLVSVPGVVRILTEVKIDPVITSFLNFSLLFIILAFSKGSAKFTIISGVLLSIAFLTKDSALTWLPVPVYLFLAINDYRTKQNLENLILFYVTFILAVIPWWVWVYFNTGQIYLASSLIHESWAFIIPWIFLSFPLIVFSVWLFRKWIVQKLSTLTVLSERLSLGFAFLVYFCVSYIFTVLLYYGVPRNIFWMISNGFSYYKYNMTVFLEWFQLVPIAWLVIGILAIFFGNLKDRLLFFLGLSCLPVWLFISWDKISVYGWYADIRQSIPIIAISYLAISRFVMLFIKIITQTIRSFLRKPITSKIYFPSFKPWLKPWLNYGGIVLVLLIGFISLSWSITLMLQRNNGKDPISYLSNNATSNWYNPATLIISKWFNENIPDNSHILLAGDLYHPTFYYETSKNFSLDLLPYQDRYTFLRIIDGKMCVATGSPGMDSAGKEKCNTSPFLYLVRIPKEELGYQFFLLEDLKNLLSQNNINYIYLPVQADYFHRTYNFLPSLFNPISSSPLIQLAFTNSNDGVNSYIYKVNQEYLNKIGMPPLILDYVKTWQSLGYETSKLIKGDKSDIDYQILRALGNREIRFVEENEFEVIPLLYIRLGNAYANHGDIDAAVRQYRAALEVNSSLASQILPAAQSLSDKSAVPSTYVLLGDALFYSNEVDSAEKYYQEVTSLQDASPEWKSAAYFGLGNIRYIENQYEQSMDLFGKAYDLYPSSTISKRILLDSSILAKKRQDFGSALSFERSIVSLNSLDRTGIVLNSAKEPEYLVHDLLSEDRVIEEGVDQQVRNDILTIQQTSHQILFEHPDSKVRWDVKIPDKSHLRFSIGLSPEVWGKQKGDGVQFNITLETQGSVYVLLDKYIDPKNDPSERHWFDYDIDLSHWSGEDVKLRFRTSSGPQNNNFFDWAGWGNPRIVIPGELSFISTFDKADVNNATEEKVRLDWIVINNELRDVIFEHPTSKITYDLNVLTNTNLCFGFGIDPVAWSSTNGDGVDFNVEVQEDQKTSALFSRYIDPKHNQNDRTWFNHCINLDQFSGQEIQLSFLTSPGPNNDSNYDWAVWSNPILVNTSDIPSNLGEK